MCRAPISSSLDRLEPARAELDIIPVVRMYETCDICKQKEHPKQMCFQCESLICENCEPSHARFNPLHTLGKVLDSGASRSFASRGYCKQHQDEPIFYFCIMCQSLLCRICQHVTCKDVFHEQSVALRYGVGFLKEFHISQCRRLGTTQILSRVVCIKAFASAFKKWLKDMEPELNECIEFFVEYKKGIKESSIETNSPKVNDRVHAFVDGVDAALNSADKLKRYVVTFKKVSTDSTIAQSFLAVEQGLLSIIRQRKRYSIETSPMGVLTDRSNQITKQVSRCHTKETNGHVICMLSLYTIDEENEYIGASLVGKLFSFWILKKGEAKKRNGTYVQFLTKHYVTPSYIDGYRPVDYEFREWNTYKSKSLEWSDGLYIQKAYAVTTTEGYTPQAGRYYIQNLKHSLCFNTKSYTLFSFDCMFGELSNYIFAIRFSNMLDLVCVFDINGTRRQSKYFPIKGLVSMVGNREKGLGLDTLFLYFDTYCCRVESLHGVCINTAKARFKGVQYPYPNTKYDVVRIEEETGKFNMLYARPVKSDYDDFTTGMYSSESVYSSEIIQNLFRCLDSKENTKYNVPVKHFRVELLCSLRSGIYYVQRMGDNNLIVGRLVASEKQVEGKALFNITQDVSPVEPNKLNPLTMVDGRDGDVVVVCSVTRTTETFVMIRLSKEGDGAIEQLDLHGLDSNLLDSSVIDLEMDLDGNFMYAIQDKDGKQYCGYTKYIL